MRPARDPASPCRSWHRRRAAVHVAAVKLDSARDRRRARACVRARSAEVEMSTPTACCARRPSTSIMRPAPVPTSSSVPMPTGPRSSSTTRSQVADSVQSVRGQPSLRIRRAARSPPPAPARRSRRSSARGHAGSAAPRSPASGAAVPTMPAPVPRPAPGSRRAAVRGNGRESRLRSAAGGGGKRAAGSAPGPRQISPTASSPWLRSASSRSRVGSAAALQALDDAASGRTGKLTCSTYKQHLYIVDKL